VPLLGTSASQNTKSFLTVPVDYLVVAGGGGGCYSEQSGTLTGGTGGSGIVIVRYTRSQVGG
jgi:hypothetical protein